tara:strand:+ start:135 stop:587 length:453 start_codon:yes stop_codon:yes gene_type:complete
MINLEFPNIELKTKILEGKTQVFDVVRKKYLLLTKEERVRQYFINYINRYKGYPLGLIGVERTINYNSMKIRADIIIYNNQGIAQMIVECKAPEVKITQQTFDQIARYNFNLKAPFLAVTNGIQHFCCSLDYEHNKIIFLDQIPNFNELI